MRIINLVFLVEIYSVHFHSYKKYNWSFNPKDTVKIFVKNIHPVCTSSGNYYQFCSTESHAVPAAHHEIQLF